jgi:hypothetical protein
MKLATERTNTPDGRLLVVSKDLQLAVPATGIAATLQDALDRWETVCGPLQTLYEQLNERKLKNAIAFRADTLAAPLPRAWQWLDASAFPTHGELMQKAFDLPDIMDFRCDIISHIVHMEITGTGNLFRPNATASTAIPSLHWPALTNGPSETEELQH